MIILFVKRKKIIISNLCDLISCVNHRKILYYILTFYIKKEKNINKKKDIFEGSKKNYSHFLTVSRVVLEEERSCSQHLATKLRILSLFFSNILNF